MRLCRELLYQFWSKLWPLGVVGAMCLVGGILAACSYYRVWSHRDCVIYRIVTRDYRIGEDLWFGRIKAGDDVEELIAQSPPYRVDRFGQWVMLRYLPGDPPRNEPWLSLKGINVVAKDGRLVGAGAWSCIWQHLFFNSLSASEEHSVCQEFDAYLNSQNAHAP